MDLFAISCLITSILSLALGVFVYFKKKKGLLNNLWAGVSIATCFWSLGLFGVVTATEEYIAFIWQHLVDLGAIFIPVFFLHFTLVFLRIHQRKKEAYKIQVAVVYSIGIALSVLSFTPLFKSGMVPVLDFNFWIDPGPFYLIFPLVFLGIAGYSFNLLIQGYFKSQGVRKKQIKYILIAIAFGFGGGMTNFFPQLINLYPIGNYFVSLYIIFVAFTITRYQFLDLKVIATEMLVVATSIALLVELFLSESLSVFLLKLSIFIAFVYLGWSLIKSVLKEIERRKEMEKISGDLKKAYSKLQKLDRAKSEFISIASHQLRTPLTAIKGFISMILEGSYGELSKKVKDPMREVYNSNERLIKLINNLLNLSKIESGTIEFIPQKASVKDIISSVIQELRFEAKKKNLYLRLEKPTLYPTQGKKLPNILIDIEKIRQVVLNIVDNAIKYSNAGGITIKVKSQEESLLVEIADTGEGMTKQEISHLFKSFSRGTAGSRLWTEGAGLGLYVSKKFVGMHNGKIWAESPGKEKGSIFYIELPIK